MIASKEVRSLEHSAVELTVTVGKDSARREYDELVNKYTRTLTVPGFRRGKVPATILIQKFGESLIEEASAKLLELSLEEAFETVEKPPLAYAVPKLKEEPKIELGKDFTFTVTYDTFPEFTVDGYKGLEISEPDVKIGEEDEQRELDAVRDRNAIVVEKKEGGSVEKGDVITVDYVELDEEGREKSGTRRQDFVFAVGSGYNLFKFDDDVVGMKKNEERTVVKSFPADFEFPEVAGRNVTVKVKVTAIKAKELPKLDDEFAQDVNDKFKTLDDLRADIRTKLGERLASLLRDGAVASMMDILVAKTEIDLPASMVEDRLKDDWESLVAQNRTNDAHMRRILDDQGTSREKLFEEWTPGILRSIKIHLIIDKIVELEKIEVSPEDLEREYAIEAERAGVGVEAFREQLKKINLSHYIEHRISDRKVLDLLIANAVITKGEKINFLDLERKRK